MSKIAPTPSGDPLLGHYRALRRDPVKLIMRSMREVGDVARFRFGPISAYALTGPEGCRYVLQENAKNYTKRSRGFVKLREILGKGLLTSDGSFWRRQRRIAQPAFHREKIAGFADAMVRAAEEACDELALHAKSGEAVDVSHVMMKTALAVVGETLLGSNMRGDAEKVSDALDVVLLDVNKRTTAFIDIPRRVPTRSNRSFNEALAALNDVVTRTIRARRSSTSDHPDLLSMLMGAKDEETGESMSDEQLRDEVMTIFLAGHETTANALTWTFYCLSQAPVWRRAVNAEIDRVTGGERPGLAHVKQLELTRRAIDEAMRLYPPVWAVGRVAEEKDEVCGYEIPAQSIVLVSPFAVHRNTRVWENPEGYDPDRFLPERASGRDKFAYFPFGGGPRMCIGNIFAQMEAVLVMATIARKFELDLVPGHPVEIDPKVTLRPKFGMKMRAVDRSVRAG